MPNPPVSEPSKHSLRANGRAFSFGRKKAELPSIPTHGPAPVLEYARTSDNESFKRPRAMTESSYASGSTATPPKLLGTEFELDQSDLDEFGNMFNSFGKSEVKLVDEPGLLEILNTENLVCLE